MIQAFEEILDTSHGLLDLYIKISSQAEHTQQLILDGQWEGVTKDIKELQLAEAEESRERERQEREEEMRREEERREKMRNDPPLLAPTTSTTTRGRGMLAPLSLYFVEMRELIKVGLSRGTARGLSSSLPSHTASSLRQPNASSAIPTSSAIPGPPSIRGSVSGVRGVRGLRSRVVSRGVARGGRGTTGGGE